MTKPRIAHIPWAALAACLLAGAASAAEAPEDAASRLEALQRQIAEQTQRLQALQQTMAQEQRRLDQVREALGLPVLEAQRGAGTGPVAAQPQQPVQAAQAAQEQRIEPVGQAPQADGRATQVAQIFEQPGVLTPRGKMVLEPSLQYSYSSTNRVALVGYTIIPAITIGVIDVREVKRSTFTAALTGRYGLTNRLELEARVPYSHRTDDSVRSELQSSTDDVPLSASGRGLGDIEFTARYQLNDGGADKPYYIGSLRYKSRTGKDPFEVPTTPGQTRGFSGYQQELPTGSGFHGLQPALTVLYPSDPAVFFGSISYLHSFARSNVTANFGDRYELIPKVAPGGVWGFNFGMGLAINEKSSFSLGYDHSVVGKTTTTFAGGTSKSLRTQLGTLLLGYSYRLSAERSLNVSLGVGVTRDTPDVTLTVRMPVTF